MTEKMTYTLTARLDGGWRWKSIKASSDAEAIRLADKVVQDRVLMEEPEVARLWIDGSIILAAPGNRAVKQMPLRQPTLQPLSTKEVAEYLGKSQRYVRDHAADLGGTRTDDGWVFDELAVLDQPDRPVRSFS